MHLCVAKQGRTRAETVDMWEDKLALAAQYWDAAMVRAESKILKTQFTDSEQETDNHTQELYMQYILFM